MLPINSITLPIYSINPTNYGGYTITLASQEEGNIIRCLKEDPTLSNTELADKLHIKSTIVDNIIKSLHKRGIIPIV